MANGCLSQEMLVVILLGMESVVSVYLATRVVRMVVRLFVHVFV